ncbi:MAG: cell division protein [Peptostreptococcaceae bacterium]
METIQKIETAKLIGIGDDGIKNLESMSEKVKNHMDLEKIAINQGVDKDFVRELLDGVDVLFLTYNSEDKRALQIVNAIAFMADERRVLSIALDSAQKENKDDVNVNREFKINEENLDDLLNLLKMMLDSVSDSCMINIDLTDLKEVLASDKGIRYSYGEFSKEISQEEIVKTLKENSVQTNDELTGKKEVILVEMDANYCEEEKMMVMLNELLETIQENSEDTYEGIFSLFLKDSANEKIKIGLIYN